MPGTDRSHLHTEYLKIDQKKLDPKALIYFIIAVTVFATAAGPTVMLFIATFGGTVSLGSPNITVQLDLLCGSHVGLPGTARLRRVDEAHANPLAAWRTMGSPKLPTPAQVAQMMAASELVNETVAIMPVDDDGNCGSLLVSLPLGYGLAVFDFTLQGAPVDP